MEIIAPLSYLYPLVPSKYYNNYLNLTNAKFVTKFSAMRNNLSLSSPA